MKTIKFLTFLNIIAITIAVVSCIEDDDYSIPNPVTSSVDISTLGTKTTFSAVVSRYLDAIANSEQVGVFSVEDDIPLYLEGYVISSDQAGNFYEEIIVQNSKDGDDVEADSRQGFSVQINVSSLSDTYEFGRKIYIKLNGLAIGLQNGVYTLGRVNGNSLVQLQEFEYRDFIIRSEEVVTITPKATTIAELVEADENTLIQLNNMQIKKSELALTYAGEASDEFDGFRTLEGCNNKATIKLQTSTFSDFKSVHLPQNKGLVQGVFTRDFGDDFNVLIINSIANINFDNAERCDPEELDCGVAVAQGTTSLFTDDFEFQNTGDLISGNGWTNYIEAGTEGWEAYSSGGANASLGISANIGSYLSGDLNTTAWLITPAINFDAQLGETLTFKTSNSFSDGSTMEVLYSTDWDGTESGVLTANWGVLPSAYIVQDSDFYGTWFSSGNVDLSCATGTMYIAFKYVGSGDANFDGSYELDEISIDYTP